MSTIDQQFVEYVVKTLVGNPDQVKVERSVDERGVLLELTVAPEDVGRVIGRRGATAQSIRMLLRALGTKNEARYNLKIVNSDSESMAEDKQATAIEERAAEEGEDAATEDSLEKTRAELKELADSDF